MNTKVENVMGGEKGENLITKRELASRLKRTVRTITNWQRRGIIPYVRWRHAVYFDWHAVQASLQPRQGLLDFAPAESRPPLRREEHGESAKGPVRLPVYLMGEVKSPRKKCRGGSGLRGEGKGRQVVAGSGTKSLPDGRGSEEKGKL